MASLADAALDRTVAALKEEPSWWESFYQWVLENWDEILKIILTIAPLFLEKEDQ